MKIPYGYTQGVGVITVNQEQAATVKLIYDLYLKGKSLGRIVNELKERGIPSSTGKPVWSRAAIDDILSKFKYVPHIISEEKYYEAQFEKDCRSNMNDNKTRKTVRYNSQNVLSGLLICEDCGRNFRRITRPSGEVVWRCADKVENGKRASCSNAVTVSGKEIKAFICEQLGLETFDVAVVEDAIKAIEINNDGFAVQIRSIQNFGGLVM